MEVYGRYFAWVMVCEMEGRFSSGWILVFFADSVSRKEGGGCYFGEKIRVSVAEI